MLLEFENEAWEQYLYWEKKDLKIVKKILELLNNTRETPYQGLGKPEALKHYLSGCYSRRINREHRLIYRVTDDKIVVISCRFHY